MPFKDQPVTDMQGKKRGGRCASIAEHSPGSQQILLLLKLRGSNTKRRGREKIKAHSSDRGGGRDRDTCKCATEPSEYTCCRRSHPYTRRDFKTNSRYAAHDKKTCTSALARSRTPRRVAEHHTPEQQKHTKTLSCTAMFRTKPTPQLLHTTYIYLSDTGNVHAYTTQVFS